MRLLFTFGLIFFGTRYANAYDNQVSHPFTISGRAAFSMQNIIPVGTLNRNDISGTGDIRSGGYFFDDQVRSDGIGIYNSHNLRTGIDELVTQIRENQKKYGTLGSICEDNAYAGWLSFDGTKHICGLPYIEKATDVRPLSMLNHFYVPAFGIGIDRNLPEWSPWSDGVKMVVGIVGGSSFLNAKEYGSQIWSDAIVRLGLSQGIVVGGGLSPEGMGS